ncbi:MAG: hypothetical protein ACJ76F_02330 [Bacteroidia bacterium]
MKWNLAFKLAALWNFSGALFALFCKDLMSSLFYVNSDPALTTVESNINYYLLYSFILVMGIGYWIVSLDPSRNKGLILVGIIGKLSTAFTWIIVFFMGYGTIMLLAGALGDLAWSLLFCYYLSKSVKKA